MEEYYNPVPWRLCEDLNQYAVATNVPVTLDGKTVIADRVVKTACPHNCYDTCGLLVYVKDEKVIKIEGDPDHPITQGTLCLKAMANVQKINSPDRVKYPMLRVGERGEGKFKRISWEEAMDYMVEKINTIQSKYGSEAIMEYGYSGNREYMAKAVSGRLWNLIGATKLVGSFCVLSGISGSQCSVGSQNTMEPDIWAANAEVIMMIGLNPTATHPHVFPYLYQAMERGAKLIVVDPCATGVAAKADLHLRPRPGTDGAMALGMIHWILKNHLQDQEYIDRYTTGFESLKELVEPWTPEYTEEITTIPKEQIIEAAELYAKSKSHMTCGCGQQRYSNGHQVQRALASLAAVCGHIGKDYGTYEFVSNMGFPGFEGFMETANVAAPKGANIKKTRMINISAVATGILNANPPIKGIISWRGGLVSQQPYVDYTLEAIKQLDMLVVIEQFMTDDTDWADLVLPGCHFLEQYGLHTSYWHHYNQIIVPVCQPYYECVPDVEIFEELGRRLGYEEYFPRNRNGIDYIRMLVGKNTDVDAAISPRGPAKISEDWAPRIPYKDGKFNTPSGKFEFYSSIMEERGKHFPGDYHPVPHFIEPEESIRATPELAAKYPLCIVSQHPSYRCHSQYYNLPWIQEIEGPAKVHINAEDAKARGIKTGDKVRIFNDRGELRDILAKVSIIVKPGVVELNSGMWVKLGGSVNVLTSLSQGGPRDTLKEKGIMYEYNALYDGNTTGYFNCLVQIEKMTDGVSSEDRVMGGGLR